MKTSNHFATMLSAQLARIETKLDKLDERLDASDRMQTEHMGKFVQLEKRQFDLNEDVRPLLKSYTVAWGISKITLGAGMIIGIITGLMSLVETLI